MAIKELEPKREKLSPEASDAQKARAAEREDMFETPSDERPADAGHEEDERRGSSSDESL